jgi:lipopolysaccharide export system protein LptA
MRYILVGVMIFCLSPAWAQDVRTPTKEPLEITAGKSLEWYRLDKKYVARGDVRARQGLTQITSDLLTADYTEGAKGSTEISLLTAEGNVVISDDENTAHGNKAIYDVPQAYAVLTGGDLKLVSPGQTITATNRMEYWSQKREAVAVGNAKVTRPSDMISADTLKAFFTQDPKTGDTQVNRMEAHGNVVVVTAEEKLTGDRGVYKAENNTAEIMGHVRIERGPNILEGERAEVNLTTNVSKMFGGATSPTGDSRVRGVFYPGSEDTSKPTSDPPSQPPEKGTP